MSRPFRGRWTARGSSTSLPSSTRRVRSRSSAGPGPIRLPASLFGATTCSDVYNNFHQLMMDLAPYRTGAMQDPASELPRILALRNSDSLDRTTQPTLTPSHTLSARYRVVFARLRGRCYGVVGGW